MSLSDSMSFDSHGRSATLLSIGFLAALLIGGCGSEASPPSEPSSETPSVASQEDHGELISQLEELRQAGKFQEGLAIVRKQLELSPESALLHFHLGLFLQSTGELDAAAEHFILAAERLNRVDVWSELGQLERRRRRLEASIDAFSRALALDRLHLPTLLGMGQVLVATDRRDEGQVLLERHREEVARQDEIDALRRTADQPGASVNVLIQLARLYRLREDHPSTEAALREALASSPGFPAATLGLANHLAHHGDAAEADRLVDSLMPQMADNAAVLFLQGTIDLTLDEAEAARAHFDDSLAKGAWPPSVYLDAGEAWSKAGHHQEAIQAFELALSGHPEKAEVYLGLAHSQRVLGATTEARKSVGRAIDSAGHPEGRALLLLAVLETELGAPEVSETFRAALEARQLDLLAADGAAKIRQELEALDPPALALEHFDLALSERHSGF